MHDYLTVEDGLIFTGPRLIVPASLQPEFMERIHANHMGRTRSTLQAKESLYWPSLVSDGIRDEVPCELWEEVHTDIF